MTNTTRRLVAVLAFVLILAPAAAWASSFEFGGADKAVHLHSQGRVNFDWAPVTGSDPAGDPVNSLYWGANDVRLFDAIGLAFGSYTLKAGDSFTGLNYNTSFWLDDASLPNILSGDQGSSYTGWDFAGTMHLTSISFPSNYELILSGQFTNMVNKVTGSAVLTDLAATGTANFTISIVANDRSASQGLLWALNSSGYSSWADYVGSVGMVVTPAVPEPGTIGMMASALAMSGGMFWRRRRTAPATSEVKAA